ncbi:hypothetical protein MWU77_23980 [Rhodococcus sp. F64268]|uniref:hypothetical protein n=1 Tax=Rhodococcus sp. F64268 TaxID=2926402 RepID=UPI001FF14DE9|nr:hypothetical protein [Rhodococcus sp. F64268]MCK0093831.1 hypothetical protein [Rhodococcus sp. F64268]
MNDRPVRPDAHHRRTRRTRMGVVGAVLAVALSATAACGSPTYPGDPLELLPVDAVAAVSLGGLGVETSGGDTLMFVFDEHGTVLGRLQTDRIDATQVLFSHRNMVAVTDDAVTVLTDRGRTDVPIDEHTVSAMANDPESGATTVWFTKGRTSGFVSIDYDQQVRQGAVDGTVRTTAYCGERHFAVVDDISKGTGPRPSRFYELLPSGELFLRGRWESDPDHGWASRTSVCAPDGRSVLALHTDHSAATTNAGAPTMVLTAIDLDSGVRSLTPLDMPQVGGGALGTTLIVLDDRLYWLNPDKQVLSVPVAGSSTVTHEWTLPVAADSTIASVHNATVTAIDYRDHAVLSHYDVRTGMRIGEPVDLPWLEPIIHSPARDTIYTLTSLAGAP